MNPYWINRFFGRPLISLDIWHSSNLTKLEYTQALTYSSTQALLLDFSEWLLEVTSTDDFTRCCGRYIEIYRRLKTERNKEKRGLSVQEAFQLEQFQ